MSAEKKFDSKQFIQTLTHDPGVYRMIDAEGKLLYVGKAKSLKKRVVTYFSKNQQSSRIAKMISQVTNVEITITNTESEALLLENNIIKQIFNEPFFAYITIYKHQLNLVKLHTCMYLTF